MLILAASYSGERAFEVYAAGHQAEPVWDALEREVRARGGCPYGLEALEFLRIEKGHIVVGAEADGRTTPHDLRLERMLRKSGGFIGASALDRPALSAPDRLQLVGLEAGEGAIPEGRDARHGHGRRGRGACHVGGGARPRRRRDRARAACRRTGARRAMCCWRRRRPATSMSG